MEARDLTSGQSALGIPIVRGSVAWIQRLSVRAQNPASSLVGGCFFLGLFSLAAAGRFAGKCFLSQSEGRRLSRMSAEGREIVEAGGGEGTVPFPKHGAYKSMPAGNSLQPLLSYPYPPSGEGGHTKC